MTDSKKLEIEIRKPFDCEWADIGKLMATSFFHEYRNLFGLNPFDIPHYFEEVFRDDHTLVAVSEGNIIGCCMFKGSKDGARSPFRTLTTIFKTVPFVNAVRCLVSVFNPSFFPSNSVHIDHICVSFNTRGEGVGRRLVGHVRDLAKKNGYDYLSLQVNSQNDVAVGLYKSMGFEIEKEVSNWSIKRTLGYESVYFMKLGL
ncbi:MAG TPA: N-acetyltransferase [Caldisericia bacterium]|nr:N-acetyltransferase [Caldisericia bacterium]HPF49102.1 N-acetyltransferase [Caldisericia bacterium]HPI83034.1 N-acetyltransferase [Caldisericia bacterium]HPQ92261.1 N-acetyltransferase [Caldisericia bacterium]HRV74641.1 N-acetyltransferase [Caldisericia bacterium]